MSLAADMVRDVTYVFTPQNMDTPLRKILAWGGLIGMTTTVALKSLGYLTVKEALALGTFSASYFLAGATTIPAFFIAPTIAALVMLALNIETSHIHFVWHIN